MAFRPIQTRERLIAWGVALVLLVLSFVQLVRLLRTPLGPATVIEAIFLAITLGLLAVLLYRLWVLHDLDYWVDRDAVRVLHAGDTVIIPLGDIQKVEYAPQWLGVKPRWLRWPNQWIHPLRPNQDIGAYATCPPAESLALSTTAGALVISPQDADGFRSALEARQKMGPARQLQPAVETSTFKQHWLLHDRPVQVLIGTGLLLWLILLAYLIWHYPSSRRLSPCILTPTAFPIASQIAVPSSCCRASRC